MCGCVLKKVWTSVCARAWSDSFAPTLQCWCCTWVTRKMEARWTLHKRRCFWGARPVCWGVRCLSHFILAVQESVAKTPACDGNNMQQLQTAVWTHHKSSSISLLSISPCVYNGAPVPLREVRGGVCECVYGTLQTYSDLHQFTHLKTSLLVTITDNWCRTLPTWKIPQTKLNK